MDYSYFLDKKCFVKSSHGLHYGVLKQDEYDYVILEEARLFIPDAFEELCPELCTIEQVRMRTVVKTVPLLQINNVKEIAIVTNRELITYYDDYDELTPSDTL